MPKKKFAFVRKERKAAAPESQERPAMEAESKTTQVNFDALVASGNHLLIRDCADEPRIVKSAEDYSGKENVIIENVRNCVVILPFSIKCLYLKNLQQSRIYVGSVSGASFINEANDCFIHLQSHQIRIHNSTNVHFYLTAKSNPIIEHCKEMKFGPYVDPGSGIPALSFTNWSEQA